MFHFVVKGYIKDKYQKPLSLALRLEMGEYLAWLRSQVTQSDRKHIKLIHYHVILFNTYKIHNANMRKHEGVAVLDQDKFCIL